MFWIIALGGVQILGMVITLARLAYDEWQQWRITQSFAAGTEDCQSMGASTMENNGNVISIGRGAANLNRPLWSFNYPHQVVSDANLSLDEKRAILSAWASDEHAVESLPTLRHLPGTPFPVTFSSIMAARILLDKMTGANDYDPSSLPNAIKSSRSHELGAVA